MALATRYDNDGYRQIRNIVRIVSCAAWAWIVYKQTAPSKDALFSSIGFPLAVTFAFVTCPIALIPATLISKTLFIIIESLSSSSHYVQSAVERRQMTRLLKQEETESAASTERERIKINRRELIDKIGSVSDFMHLLQAEQDPARLTNIRLGVIGALRELIGKYSLNDLSDLIHSDPAVAATVAKAISDLGATGFGDAVEVTLLTRAANVRAP